MKKILALILLTAALSSTFEISTASATELAIVGGITNGKLGDYKAGKALSYGALLSGGNLGFGLETGLLSIGKKMSAGGVDFKGRALEVPLLLRLSLPLLSAGAGAYYQSYTDKPVGASQKSTDYGLKIDGRIRLPIAPLSRFVIDLAYKKGLANISNIGGSLKNSEIDLLAGVSFGF